HGVDIVRHSRRHHCPLAVRYVCGDRAGRRRGFHRRPVGRDARSGRCESLALARADGRLGSINRRQRRRFGAAAALWVMSVSRSEAAIYFDYAPTTLLTTYRMHARTLAASLIEGVF